MHDVTFANKILDLLDIEVEPGRRDAAIIVNVILGPSTHVNAESLTGAFNGLPGRDKYTNVTLNVETGTTTIECRDCGAVSAIKKPTFACPKCGKSGFKVHPCEEFVIKSIEIES